MSKNMEARMFDVLSVVISVSNMLMLYGVSDSIKKSVDRLVRAERIVSTLDELISNSDIEDSVQLNTVEPDELIEKFLERQHTKGFGDPHRRLDTNSSSERGAALKMINGSQLYKRLTLESDSTSKRRRSSRYNKYEV
jgi:hypothetical protein